MSEIKMATSFFTSFLHTLITCSRDGVRPTKTLIFATVKNILHITTWYPNDYDPQLGIFVKKHIQLGHTFANNMVIAIIPDAKVNRPRVVMNKTENFTEIIGYYRARSGSKWSNYRNYQRIQTLVLQELLKTDFAPDAIHCHVGEKSIAFAQKFFGKIPRVVTEHWSGFLNGTFETYKTKRKAKRIQEINTCQKLVVVSDSLKIALQKHGVTISVEIIPNIIEQGKVKTSFNSPHRFVVIADLVDEVKNISGIIDAFKKANLTETTLTIVGDGKDREQLERISEGASIEFLGRQDNKWILNNLCNYDCLIVNSKTETYSMVTAEALLCGLPVIATKCGGPEQFINHGKNGWLIDVGDENQLISSLQTAAVQINDKNPVEIRQSVLEKVDTEQIQEKFKSLYQ